MKRTLEPELMENPFQVAAYAEADFSEPHSHFIKRLKMLVNPEKFTGTALDLGCGPGDIACRFAEAFPLSRIDAVDGSLPMLEYARRHLPDKLRGRINFLQGVLPDFNLPSADYNFIFSNSLLHHLPDPEALWQFIARYAKPGTLVAVMDLLRPANKTEARRLVEIYAQDEPVVLQHDFYHSLLAAFTLPELEAQISTGTFNFKLEQISDRHVFISGTVS